MSHFFPSLSSFSANACIVVCSNAERILSIDDSVSDIVVVVISPNRMPRVDVVLYVDFLSARRMRAVVGVVVGGMEDLVIYIQEVMQSKRHKR